MNEIATKENRLDKIENILEHSAAIIGNLAISVADIKKDTEQLGSRLVLMEEGFEEFKRSVRENERISRAQYKRMNSAIRRRIYVELLGDYPLARVRKVYARRFFTSLYRDARENANMAEPASETKKMDYDAVMDFVEAWRPKDGVAAFVAKIEEIESSKQVTLNEIISEGLID